MSGQRHVCVVTGSRAEFGLLRPVMESIRSHVQLRLSVIAAGAHLLPPTRTIEEVQAEFDVALIVPMQEGGETGRFADAVALGRGVERLARAFDDLRPDYVLVLGDRIEAFAAAAAASIGGIRVAHMHGGDRAEGIADESVRHAITKLAHIHLPATEASAERIIAMGEHEQTVHIVGSPAIDDLARFGPLTDDEFVDCGSPQIVFLMHPVGRPDDEEEHDAARVLEASQRVGRTCALDPNHDSGRAGIVRAIESAEICRHAHLPRRRFVGLLRRAKVLVGNSSAGLIEAAALGLWCVNIGPRQGGRERPGNVIDVLEPDSPALEQALRDALEGGPSRGRHPYGDGRAGARTATILATLNFDHHPLRKRNTY